MTIDSCQLRYPYGFDPANDLSLRPYWFHGLRLVTEFGSELTVANNRIDGHLDVSGTSRSAVRSVRIVQNHVVARCGYGVSVDVTAAYAMVISHNVISHCQNATYFRELNPVFRGRSNIRVSNNLFLATSGAIWFGGADANRSLSRSVRIQNNLFVRPNVGISLDPKDADGAAKTWQVDHNGYPRAPERGEPPLVRFPAQPTDVLVSETKFLSTNPADPNYLRIPADSPLATGGAGGDLPNYIGPCRPGPAPKRAIGSRDYWTQPLPRGLRPGRRTGCRSGPFVPPPRHSRCPRRRNRHASWRSSANWKP